MKSVARELFGEDAERRIKIIAKHGYTLVGDVHPAEADRVAGQRTPGSRWRRSVNSGDAFGKYGEGSEGKIETLKDHRVIED